MEKKNEIINSKRAAEIMGVSNATILNWEKTNLLKPVIGKNKSKHLYLHADIEELKSKIISGEISRLNKRRNKSYKEEYVFPFEYCKNAKIKELADKFLSLSNKYYPNKKRLGQILISIYYLIYITNFSSSARIKRYLMEFELDNNLKVPDALLNKIIRLVKDGHVSKEDLKFDFLGTIYLYSTPIKIRKKEGQYFTPDSICQKLVEDSIGSLDKSDDLRILDPAAGTGNFLLYTIIKLSKEKFKHALELNAWEKDPLVHSLLKINLEIYQEMYKKNLNIKLNINRCDSLSKNVNLIRGFNLIISNPPWGKSKNIENKTEFETYSGSEDIASLFVEKGINLLCEGGIIAYVIPSSLLTVNLHTKLRKFLFKTNLLKISDYNSGFKSVIAPCLSIISKKTKGIGEMRVELYDKNMTCRNSYFLSNLLLDKEKGKPFYYYIPPDIWSILKKIENNKSKTLNLKESKWALGVVTGNNSKYLLNEKITGAEPIYTGKEVLNFLLDSPKKFIRTNLQSLQQVAPEEIYRSKEKLVYRFISNNLIFAYDNSKSLILNSANIVIPKKNIGVLGLLLNSKILNYYYKSKFRTHKVLRSNLENLPFPKVSEKDKKTLIQIHGDLQSSKKNLDSIQGEIDRIVLKAFNLKSFEVAKLKEFSENQKLY